MRPRDLVALEFDHVRNRLADFARSPGGKQACRTLTPSRDRTAVAAALDTTWQCLRLIEAHGNLPIGEFADTRESLRIAARDGAVLDGAALVEIRTVLAVAQAARAFLRQHAGPYPRLAGFPDALPRLPALQATLTRALDDTGAVTDDASDELAEVRRTIRHLRDTLTRRLDAVLGRADIGEILSDRYVTIRNNRFVIPIKTAAATHFDGVVQDRSVSGETTFVEPKFAVELNNRLLLAAKDEEMLVRRVLADLTAMVRLEHDTLATTDATLVELDALAARARFAQCYRCTQPRLDDDEVMLRQARHPVLLSTDRPVTPIDLLLPRGKRVLVITGPNTGGKTVALKTLGLHVLMAQSGVLIPAAEGSHLPCFGAIYTDVGDDQSIERNLSTFSAHVANLKEIVDCSDGASLVLLDEPGVGTDPDDGAALGIGLLRTLAAAGVRVAVSTHSAPIKVFALGDERCVTAAVDFDVEHLVARYRLTYHTVGESMALPIARRLGLPEPLLQMAEAARSEQTKALAAAVERLEEVRRTYELRLSETDDRLRAARDAQAEADRLLADLREKRQRRWADELAAARQFVATVREQGRGLLEAIQKQEADRHALARWTADQQAAIETRAAETTDAPAEDLGPPQVGDEVEVSQSGIRGTLLSADGGRAWIQRGSLRFEVPAAHLRRLGGPAAPHVEVRLAPPSDDAVQEISLLGLRAREAVNQLDDFLDRALRVRCTSVRIIHGLGSGALRRAVHDYLTTSPYCAAFRGGEAREGGAGVTIATLATD